MRIYPDQVPLIVDILVQDPDLTSNHKHVATILDTPAHTALHSAKLVDIGAFTIPEYFTNIIFDWMARKGATPRSCTMTELCGLLRCTNYGEVAERLEKNVVTSRQVAQIATNHGGYLAHTA
ncbi:uncharacterized protein LOC110855732 isoform X2 [Folsomia candida]|uniref:uncharacterized protein LOC110855732 isoform X2 n=1 Tax=Folsomia candida TaxID=158441 RepID=UPI00160519AD|nr:uncharacterized protein LOC110855732 isoform X2 [Folsomia candida]